MYFGPVNINLLSFKINSIDHSAIVNLGPSKHLDIFVSYKRSQGIGEQNGDFSPILLTYSNVIDNDISDSPTVKNSII
ncbi:hypothetical protein [Neobacillus mesonae]|uniref:Spore germination protein n=1 Tax=Neobacillus mesonae TaxID=1193713 RepID=A0A3Q9QS29_9BACI|nr:hypothetical protein [Neobacillus mesonae]AZU61868.1 hypothetical protein CHR53_11585 [Neobacillus mesonae]